MKFKIEFIDKEGGRWVKVVFGNNNWWWIPSFKQMCDIIRAIGVCEDEKYPNGRGRWMQMEMYEEALRDMDNPVDDLAITFDIPERQ